ncbi:hypothetical protein BV22DRAFT_809619 [Leucogyrophana mollusca]|uniref:Uncharacterized protein n=1 Tax=Leucogyrophana mollusca TaxID=85980 RepID=A0ACB8B3Q4_9AGAM|nr:hypothetical protein BV22DRAFT_809619 [Leucogyrophana mollusca]
MDACPQGISMANSRKSTPKPPFSSALSLTDIEMQSQSQFAIPGQAIPLKPNHVSEFLHSELSVSRLNEIHEHLWMAGRRDNLHPIHWQKMTGRDIRITEYPYLHLLWYDSTIFIKPIPVCLLDYEFFAAYICPHRGLFGEACGFLRSYALLIRHESDFKIAMDVGLLPRSMTWKHWSALAYELVTIPKADINKRYFYGELRLLRLNLVMNLYRRKPWYHNIHRDYHAWLSYQLRWMLVAFAYTSIVLGAMQVLTATSLASELLSAACFWFSIVTALLVFVVLGWQMIAFFLAFTLNFIAALQ